MSDLYISSKQNNLVKFIRGLREKRNREKESCYVIEGAKSVLEATAAGVQPSKLVISERGEKHFLTDNILSHLDETIPVARVTDEVMDYMGETDTPQGVLAIFPMPEVSLCGLTVDDSSLFVVIDGVQDPGNVGTIIRTADAFGVRAVILTKGSADVYNSKTLRSSMGSVFHIPVVRDADILELVSYFKQNAVLIASTTLAEQSLPLTEIDFIRPVALVFGSEGRGVSPDIISHSDVLVKIPITGLAESLNVAIASGIILYEAFRQLGLSSTQTCK